MYSSKSSPKSQPSLFKQYQREFHQSLDDEIKSLQKLGGQTTTITDGHHIGKRNGKHLYSFSVDTEIRLPDDTPIILVYQEKRYRGILLSVEGFDLIIAIEEDIGKKVSSIRMTTEPWFLLQELQQRLETAANGETSANLELALSLLSDSVKSHPIQTNQFDDFCPRIETQLQQPLTYNRYQSEAVTHVLQHPVSFIWGPPGTGKTSTLGLTVASLVHAGESVLILAHSNTAVDTAMRSLAKYLCKFSYYKEGLILRFGIAEPGIYDEYPLINVRGIAKEKNIQLIDSIENLEHERKRLTQESRRSGLSVHGDKIAKIREVLKSLKQQLRQEESELVCKAEVVGCTLSKATIAQEIYERQFDAVIIDEASMAYIPHCAYAATLAKRRIAIFGDFRQLSPISQADTELAERWLKRDIFDEAGIINRVNQNERDDRMVLLQTQYRMHPSISAIPNQLFYSNQLQDGEGIEAKTQPIADAPPNPGHPLIFYDLSRAFAFCFSDKESHSRFNPISALLAVDIAFKSSQTGSKSIGIITPYKAQARLIHRLLRESNLKTIKASTVHRFQGSEQHLIIFDAVDSTPQANIGQLLKGGKQGTAARLSNVAVSRAQGKFIALLNDVYIKKQLDSFNIFRKFNDRLRSSSHVLPLSFTDTANSYIWTFSLPGVTVHSDPKKAKEAIEIDLAEAQDTVAIDWPIRCHPTQHFSLSCLQSGLHVIARGEHIKSQIASIPNARFWSSKSFSTMGIVGIDEHILWIYTNPKSQHPVFRIAIPDTVRLLYSFLTLTPTDSGVSIAKKLKNKQAPLGSCEICQTALWPKPGKFRNSPPRISCLKHLQQGRNMNSQDAARYAQFMNLTCNVCGAAWKGARNSSTGQIFLACSHNGCKGKTSLDIYL